MALSPLRRPMTAAECLLMLLRQRLGTNLDAYFLTLYHGFALIALILFKTFSSWPAIIVPDTCPFLASSLAFLQVQTTECFFFTVSADTYLYLHASFLASDASTHPLNILQIILGTLLVASRRSQESMDTFSLQCQYICNAQNFLGHCTLSAIGINSMLLSTVYPKRLYWYHQ